MALAIRKWAHFQEEGIQIMAEAYIECSEVIGKKIQRFRIYRDTGDGMEMQIDFPDGTVFTCCFSPKPILDAKVIRPGVGHPELIRAYSLD